MKQFLTFYIGLLIGLAIACSLGSDALDAQQRFIFLIAKEAHIHACLPYQTRVKCEIEANEFVQGLRETFEGVK